MAGRLTFLLIPVLFAAGCLGSGETVISKEVDLKAGGYSVDGFEVSSQTKMSYNTTSQNRGAYDVCIFLEDQLTRFKAGVSTEGPACNERVRRATDSAILSPGSYYFGIRCPEDGRGCVVAIQVTAE